MWLTFADSEAGSNMELWLRERIFSFASVIMRVPPLFVIDELLRIGLGLTEETVVFNSTKDGLMMECQDGGAIESTINAAGNLAFNAKNWSGLCSSASSYSIYSNQMFLMTALRVLACCAGKAECFLLLADKWAKG